MGISAIGLNAAVQSGLSTYTQAKQLKMQHDFYEELGKILADRRAFAGDKGGSKMGPQLTDDTSQAQGVTPAAAAAMGQQPTMQTVTPATAPQPPAVAQPVGYAQPAAPAGLATAAPTPMVTRPITGQQQPSPYTLDPLLTQRTGLGG